MNPFETVDDEEFVSRGRGVRSVTSSTTKSFQGGYGYGDSSRELSDEPLSEYDRIQQQIQASMNRQLASTDRSMAHIYESEAIGIATAEELMKQGEQLDNIERKVEKINADTRTTQRHLNGIKSIFGGIKNWWQGESKTVEAEPPTTASRNKALSQAISSSQDTQSRGGVHPALRIRSEGGVGFGDDDDDSYSGKGYSSSNRVESHGQMQGQVQGQRSAQWNRYEEKLNENLNEMSSGLSNLKSLAVGLQSEIETQNDQLDRIMPKVDRADTKIRDQNRQMRQILGK